MKESLGQHFIKRSIALITLAAVTATSSFAANYNTSLGTTDWFTASNYHPVGVPDAATAVRILTTTDVAAEINTLGALASAIDLGLFNWPGKLVVGASGTLDVTGNLVARSADKGDQTSSLTNNGVITLGLSLYSRGINTFDNSGTLTAAGIILGGNSTAQTTFTNTGLIDVGAGWIHFSTGSTVATEFNMNGGTLTAGKLNVQGGGKANLNLHGGTITAGSMADASADFHIDVNDDGELILNGDVVSELDSWIVAGYIFTSAGSGGAVALYDADSHTTRLYADTSAPTPDPAGFDGAPVGLDTTSVGMLATLGSDASGVVEYLFTETSGNSGGTSSSWQSSPYYEDAGLTAGLQYSYTVTMRDAVGNVGAVSTVRGVTVPATTPADATAAQSGGWSDPATWGGSLPAAESDVTIPMGLEVTLVGDQECGSITVMGKLTADPAADCSLHCDWVMIMGAGSAFEVGTNALRYPHQFTLTLKGLASEGMTVGSHNVGSKFLVAMNGGTIDIHGPERVSWTKLSATSVAGSTTLTLDDAVDWVAGEMLVVTSTDTNWNHAEERTIAAVSGDGLTVTLTEPLAYTHTGVTETHTRPSDGKSWSIELKAEVGLLSRAVTIQGDIYSEYAGIGGHTMAMQHDGMAAGALYVEGAELYRMGQKAIMGRYPIHWHLMTDQAQGQYVRNSSIHHSFNRAVTIHGTDYITVEDNFCYDHIGHGIFLENGAERFNTIRGNVVLLTRRPAPGEELTPSDNSHDEFQNRTPASYWITNPNNTIEDNIAAGTQGTGYWFIFPTTPLEPAASLPYYDGAEPSKQPLGKFDRNTAHSCMNGLDINDQLKSDHSIRTNGAWDNDGPFYFNDCAWFSNDTALYAGIGGRKQNVVYYNHTIADNIDSIILATYHTVEESMLIADSGHGNLLGAAPTMYWIYDGAGQMVDNHMIGWDADHANLFSQPGASTKHPNHRFSGFTWDHAGPPRNVHTRFDYTELPPAGALASTGHNSSNPSVWGQVVYDLDGSVAGLPGGALVTNHPFMVTGSETMPDNWARNLISPNRFAHLRCTYSEFPPNVSVLRTKIGIKTEGFAYDDAYISVNHHQLPLIVNDGFLYTYSYESLPSSRKINLNFDDTEVGDSVLLRFKHFGQLSGLSVTGTAHGSLASLEAASSAGYYVEPSGDLYLQPLSTQLYDNLLTITWSGSLSLPMLDADLDGVDDMAELYNGTDPFGFVESINDSSEFTQAADFNGWSANADVSSLAVSGDTLNGTLIGNAAALSKTDLNFNGNSAPQVRVRYKHDSNGTVDFYWSTSVSNNFSATRQLSASYTGAGEWQELRFDLDRQPQWLDHVITGIRLELNGNTGDFEIDYIRGTGSYAGLIPATVAHSQSLTLIGEENVSIRLTGADPDNDPLTYVLVSLPSNGSLSGAAPYLSYTPDAAFVGVDSFTFTVTDGTSTSPVATVSILVGGNKHFSGGAGAGDPSWFTASNWSVGWVPTIADDIQAIAPFTFPYGVVVDAPGAIANSMAVGIWGHLGELNITVAGSLSVTGNLLGSQGDGDQGSVINNDGALIVGSVLRLAGNGVGTLNMNGGTVEANKLWMASVEGTATLNMNGGIITADTFTMSLNSIAQLNLYGGTIAVGELLLNGSDATIYATNTIAITEGMLIADGDQVAAWTAYQGLGSITAYGGAGSVMIEYDSQADTTSMWADLSAFPELDPQLAPVGDLNRDGVLDQPDVAVANSYLDGSIDGGVDAAARQSLRMAQGMTAAEALADLNLTEFDVDGDGTFDAADVALLEDVVNGVAPVSESAGFNGSDDFELVVDGLLSGKTYYLKRATDLSAGFTETPDAVTADSRTETFIDVDPPVGNAFYQVTD